MYIFRGLFVKVKFAEPLGWDVGRVARSLVAHLATIYPTKDFGLVRIFYREIDQGSGRGCVEVLCLRKHIPYIKEQVSKIELPFPDGARPGESDRFRAWTAREKALRYMILTLNCDLQQEGGTGPKDQMTPPFAQGGRRL